MTEPTENPYAAPQTEFFPNLQERRTSHRTGALLLVTIFHVTIEGVCFLIASLLALGIVLSHEWGRASLAPNAVAIAFLGLVPYLAFLLYAEFRGFRPMRSRERLTLWSTLSASLFPMGIGVWLLREVLWHGQRHQLPECLIWLTIAFLWMLSIGLRAQLAFGKTGHPALSQSKILPSGPP